MTIRLTLDDLTDLVDILAQHGFQQVTDDTWRWAWEGLTETGRSIGLTGQERRVIVTSEGTLIVREPGTQTAWRQTRYVECGDDTQQMLDELVNAGILTWGYHSVAGQSLDAMLLAAADPVGHELTPAAVDLLADGRSSGACDA